MNLTKNIDKFGVLGLFIIAFFSPCCFPIVAFVASAFGLGNFELFGGWTMWVFLVLVLVSVSGLFFSYKSHKSIFPFLLALFSGSLIFVAYFIIENENWIYLIYIGMFGLLISTFLNFRVTKKSCNSCSTDVNKKVILESTISCPICKHKENEIMPTDSCSYFYECENCKTVLKPLKGDCCVYCSYGSVKCPPIQNGDNCCS